MITSTSKPPRGAREGQNGNPLPPHRRSPTRRRNRLGVTQQVGRGDPALARSGRLLYSRNIVSITTSSSRKTRIRPTAEIYQKVGGLRIIASRRRVWRNRVLRFEDHVLANKLTIGRGRHRSIRLRDTSVSALHCVVLRQRNGGYIMRDQSSRTGIYVSSPYTLDGRWYPSKSTHLHLGMQVRLGNLTFLVTDRGGLCPIREVSRFSEFCRKALSIYGTVSVAAKAVGLSPAQLGKALRGREKTQGKQ